MTWLEQWLSSYGADKADLALAISLFSLAVSAASAFYTRALAKIEAEKMRRKALVFEPMFRKMREWPGCFECEYRVRNLEPVSGFILKATSRNRKIKLVDFEDAHVPDGAGSVKLKPAFPLDLAERTIDINRTVGACSDSPSAFAAGPIVYIRFYANGDLKPSDVKIATSWADGVKH